jgi:hypothetical protein
MNLGETRTARRAEIIFGTPMKACPTCGSYNFRFQTPIKLKEPVASTDTAAQLVGKWARAIKDGNTPLEGPVFIMCFDCGHKSAPVDCTGMTAEEVGRSAAVAKETIQRWNA